MTFFAAEYSRKDSAKFQDWSHINVFAFTHALTLFWEDSNAHLENLRWKHGNLGSLKTYLQSYRCTDANPTKNWRPSDLQPINACTWSIPQRGRTEKPSTKKSKKFNKNEDKGQHEGILGTREQGGGGDGWRLTKPTRAWFDGQVV